MSAQNNSELSNNLAALARYVGELAIPEPFDLHTFGCWIEQHGGHSVRLIPTDMGSGALSGLMLRQSRTNYLYYEQQASLYHQSHIILCLAARLLFDKAAGLSIDPRLTPDLSPQLGRLMFKDPTDGMPPAQAEVFSFLALNRAGSARLTRKNLQRLSPLHEALCSAVPRTDSFVVPDSDSAIEFLLHRRIIDIRDAMLALRSYIDPEVAAAALAACQAAGTTSDDLAAAAEASVLASALEARIADQSPRYVGNQFRWRKIPGSGLPSEAAWLGKVAQAFSRITGPGEHGALERTDTG
jgi:hypothetical protein